MDYKSTELQSVCSVTSSKRIYAKELCSSGVPFYRSKEIIERLKGVKEYSNPLYISEDRYQEIIQKAGPLIEGDLLLTSRGTLGVPYIVTANDRFHFADGNLTWFRDFNGLDSNYLKYFFLSPVGKGELKRCVIGSSQAAYTIVSLKKISIPLPGFDYQLKVVEVLSNYDNLIENNNRRIAILEDMAQSLYREWFVKFRFPGHEGVKFKGSSLGEIPINWNVVSLSELMDIRGGSQPPKKEWVDDEQEGYVRMLQIRDYQKDSYIAYVKNSKKLRKTDRKEILIARYGASVARILYGLEGAYNVAIAKVIEKKTGTREFLRWFLKSDYFQKTLIGMSGRAAQNGFNKDDIKAIQIVYPEDNDLVNQFEKLTLPLYEQALKLSDLNRILTKQRDMLLPKLISGQINLNEAIP